MKRWILDLPNGYAIAEEDGWGRQISTNSSFARDLDPERDKELLDRIRREGKEAVGSNPSEALITLCKKEEKPVLNLRGQRKLF